MLCISTVWCTSDVLPLCHWVAIVRDALGGGFHGTRLAAGSGAGVLHGEGREVLEVRSQEFIGPSAKNPEQVPVLRALGQPAEGLPVIQDALRIRSQGFETFALAEATTFLHFLILAPD